MLKKDMIGVREDDFNERFTRAIKGNGIVVKDLKIMQFPILEIGRHPFTGTGNQAIEKARKWAEDNIVGIHDYHLGKRDWFRYEITGGYKGSIGKMLSGSSTGNSDNLGIHLAVLKKLLDVIDYSIDVEIHPDIWKTDGRRKEGNEIGNHILVHRLYGATLFEGTVYRVKTTIKEYRSSKNGVYTYRVTKVELPISGSETSNALDNSTSIDGAKLLKGVEKSYDKGKKLLDES